MTPLRFAAIGAGFWARFQLSAWRELPGATCVAVCDRDRAKAERLARDLGIPAAYDDAGAMLDRERPDFVDIITDPGTHARFVHLAASKGIAAICQKPLGESLEEARGMLDACRRAGVPLLVHENFRWQAPMRELAAALRSGRIGTPFRARIDFVSAFDVFANQPNLRELEQFLLTDIGTHILDLARFLFGEADGLFATIRRVRPEIKGEDVATVTLTMRSGATVACNMAYAGTPLERDRFPETFVFVEGDAGSAELAPDYWVRVTTAEGTRARRVAPPRFAWADPAYDLVHASLVPCNANLLAGLRGEARAETTGEDNFETLRLVFAAYESAAGRRFLSLDEAR